VYKPPADDEQRRDNELDAEETTSASRVRRRQSASPRKPPIKPYKAYYSDDHPEVPKIRRASLQQTRIEVLPQAQEKLPEHGDTESHRWNTPRRKQAEMPPFTGLEEEDLPEHGDTEPHRWNTSRRKHVEIPPFTGLERYDEDDPDTMKHERLSRKLPASTKSARPSSVRQRPTSAGLTRQHASNRSTTRVPFLGRRQSWIMIGILALIIIILAPILSKIFGNPAPTTSPQQTSSSSSVNTQGVSTSQLQSIASNAHELVITPPQSGHPAPPIYATSAFLLDTDNETTLYAQNAFLHLPMLSTTKLMTATLAVQEGNLDQEITINAAMEHDIQQLSADSALFGVKQGQTYTLRDLLYGLLYVSGNDAALIIADALAGNVQNFVAQMNQKAQELGLHDTHFVNPHGLLDAGQYSCARDLAVLGQYSLSIPLIQQISSGKTYHIAAGGNHDARVLLNENQFLWWYPGVQGGKTGYDGESDFIQVMSVVRDNHHMIGVVMHTNDWWTDMRNLMDYGSDDYTWISPRNVDASGQPVPYDSLWNYFVKDTQDNTIPSADQGEYFIDTGYSVSGPLLTYFNQQSGLKKFGFPIKDPTPTSSTVMSQQFQHGTIQCDLSSNKCSTV
jgi:D-alanyl-D-alanine carboxypeptidase